MKTLFAASLLFLLTATTAFAHAGHIHKYLGSVTAVHGDHEFRLKTNDGKELTIETSAQTAWRHADDHAATKADLAVGERVVVTMMSDDKTAAMVKMSAAKKK